MSEAFGVQLEECLRQLHLPSFRSNFSAHAALARIDHRFGNEGDFGRPERFSESFAIDPVQVE